MTKPSGNSATAIVSFLLAWPALTACTTVNNLMLTDNVGPSALAVCSQDERIMPQYRAYQAVFKRLVGGVREGSTEVSCYWGTISDFTTDESPLVRCRRDGNICAFVMAKDDIPVLIPSNSIEGREILKPLNDVWGRQLSGHTVYAQRLQAWEDAFGSSPQIGNIQAFGENSLTTKPTQDYSVVWYLLGAFAQGVAQGLVQAQFSPQTNVTVVNSARSANGYRPPIACTPSIPIGSSPPNYICR